MKNTKIVWVLVVLAIALFVISGCESSSSYSSSSRSYGTRESYDAKYGAGAYDADKALLDSMRDNWNNAH